MIASLTRRLRELLRGPSLWRARRSEERALALAIEGTVHPALVAELTRLRSSPDAALQLARLVEGAVSGRKFLVDAVDMLAHMLVIGMTGSGKTFFVLKAVRDLLPSLGAFLLLDMKGEASEILTASVLPSIAASLPPAERDVFLQRIIVVDPFSPDALPPLNVLARDPGLPVEIQARDVAECFETASETDVTSRMETILDWCLRLAIDVRASFLAVRRALQEPAVLDGLVRQCTDRDVVRYFVTRFPAEPKGSKLALLSRMDRFLSLPMTRLCLGANACLDFDTLIRDRIVIVNLGRAPAGLQSVARFFAMVVMTRIVRAIFRRPPRGNSKPMLLLADEWQHALNPALAGEFSSVLELARSRNVHLWLCNQQLGQLDRHGAALRSVVLGQTATQVAFRLSPDDAQTLRSMFPRTGTMLRSRGAPWEARAGAFLGATEETEARVHAASRLPQRVAYWSDRRKPWGTVLVRSERLPVADPASLPRAIVDRTTRGSIAFSRAELEQMRVDEEQRLDALAAGRPPSAGPGSSVPPPGAPPRVARRPPRRGGGGLPNV